MKKKPERVKRTKDEDFDMKKKVYKPVQAHLKKREDDNKAENPVRVADADRKKIKALNDREIKNAVEKEKKPEIFPEIKEQKKNDSERALKNQIYKNKIELARTRIKRMHGYLYQPSNMQILIDSAKEALDACKGYSEYYNLKAMFDMYKKELEELPVKGESNKKNQTPTDTSEPVATEEPQEEE